MTPTLDYLRPAENSHSRWMAFFATLTLVFPLVVLASLYGQWLLSWAMLGRPPQPSWDDPVHIVGASWMHPITSLAIIGFFPGGGCAVLINILYILHDQIPPWRALLRMLTVV